MTVVIRFTDDVDIPVGDRIHLEIDHKKVEATIVGHVASDILFISPPTFGGGDWSAEVGSKISGRFISGSKPFGFESTLVNKYKEPIPIWAVSFPDRFQSLSVRRSERVNTFVPGSVKNEDGEIFPGTLLDVSDGGCLFSAEKGLFELEEKLMLSIEFPEGKPIHNLLCEVRHLELSNDIASLGLRLSETKGEGFELFSAYYNLVSGNFDVPPNLHSIYPI